MNEARRILATYAPKIKHVAKKEGCSVNELLSRKTGGRNEIMRERITNEKVKEWRFNERKQCDVSISMTSEKSKARDGSNEKDYGWYY